MPTKTTSDSSRNPSTTIPTPSIATSTTTANRSASGTLNGIPAAGDTSGSANGGAANNGSRRVKGKRTRTGCLTCRARKVKCDEAPGTCANCERVLLACRWPAVRHVLDERAAAAAGAGPPSTGSTEASSSNVKVEPKDGLSPSSGPIRRNRQAACVACRIARCRCSQDQPACARCVEHGTACEYTSDRSLHSVSGRTPSSAEASPSELELERRANLLHGIPRSLIDRHVDAFFAYVYPVQCNAIVHRGSLMSDIKDGKVSRKILLAICACAARFVDHSQPGSAPHNVRGSSAANAWANEAKGTILSEDTSIESITAALILAKHDINSGRFSQAFVLAAVAMRMSLSLRLHHEPPVDDELTVSERETRRRLMWGCYSLDRMMSTGVAEFLITPVDSLNIRLPCDDHRYLYGMATDTPVPALEREGDSSDQDPAQFEGVGILAHHLRLQGVRNMIFRVSRNREPSDLPPWDPSSAYVAAERKILAWYDSLSPQFQLSPDTIYARKLTNDLTPLTMIHIWYHQNISELTRLALPGFKDSLEPAIASTAPPGWIDSTREQCVNHARMIANTLRHVDNLVGIDNIIFGDSALPICVYESVRVRLQFAFLLPPGPQVTELTELAADVEIMFGYLIKMSQHFQNARWLLRETRRMLQRHGLDGTVHSDTSGAASPNGADPWSTRVRGQRDSQLPKRPEPQYLHPAQQPQQPPPQLHLPVGHQQQVSLSGLPVSPVGILAHQTMYAEPQSYSSWSQYDQGQDEVVALLNEYSQSQSSSGVGSFGGGMFDDWVAFGYDRNAMAALDPPLQAL